jgi:hypothetical protein
MHSAPHLVIPGKSCQPPPMLRSRPVIFISAVSRELRSARDLVAKTLIAMGYEPKWQDIAPTLRRSLSHSIPGFLRRAYGKCAVFPGRLGIFLYME